MSKKLLLSFAAFMFLLSAPITGAAGTSTTPLSDIIQKQIDALPEDAPQDMKRILLQEKARLQNIENPQTATSTPARRSPAFPENAESCFNLFRFGSVQVNVSPAVSESVPGTPVTFVGTLENENTYPIVGGSVYVKIFDMNGGDTQGMRFNGYPLIDQFIAERDISIDAKTKKPIQFSWDIPKQLQGGKYQAAFYFVGNDRFNILGLSFSDDVSGNKTPFSVKETAVVPVVSFDKNSVTTNGQPSYFAQPPLVYGKDEVVKIKANIVNPSTRTKTVTVKRSTYNWDSQRPESLIEEHEDIITLSSKETKAYEYGETKHTGTVTLVVLTLTSDGVKSILNVRFARQGANETRFNFASIARFPIEKGKQNILFACEHSTFGNTVPNQEVTLTLTDTQSGALIDSYTYTGGIVSNVMAVKKVFTSTTNSSDFTLTATLKNNGKVVDTFTETYDCKVIDPVLCKSRIPWVAIVVGVLGLLILSGGGWWIMRRLRERRTYEPI